MPTANSGPSVVGPEGRYRFSPTDVERTLHHLGLLWQLHTEGMARAGLDKDTPGLWVQEVDPDGRAAAAGLQPNDVIQEVNRTPVDDVEDLRTAVRSAASRPVLLLVHRGGRDLFVTVRPS